MAIVLVITWHGAYADLIGWQGQGQALIEAYNLGGSRVAARQVISSIVTFKLSGSGGCQARLHIAVEHVAF